MAKKNTKAKKNPNESFKGLQGHCAKCGSLNITYGYLKGEGQEMYYDYTCGDCKHGGQERYYMEFVEST